MSIEKQEVPANSKVYKSANPCKAKIIHASPLSTKDSPDEMFHIELEFLEDEYLFIEGQSMGVVPSGLDSKGKPHKLRLYSIASSRKADDGRSKGLSICVKRVVYKDEKSDKTIKGVASNLICDWNVGDIVEITGPTGKAFVLPKNPNTDLILLATGTGIAPFRSFLQYIFRDRADWSGRVLLFYGAKTKSELLYANDMNSDLEEYKKNENFQSFYSLSREVFDDSGNKIYIQDLLIQQARLIWEIIKSNQYSIYICGLKGMENGIKDSFQSIFSENNENWDEVYLQLKSEGRWNKEVY